jgi:hypothetical protein
MVPLIPFPHKASTLVWIRRDLFISRRFSAADCYPAWDTERIGRCKEFKFSRDWWSWRGGGKEICEAILKMVQAGRGSGRQSGGRGSGGTNSGGGNPPVARPPSSTSMRPSSSLQGTQFLNPPQIGGQPGYGTFQQNMWSNPQL